jgi:transposase
VDSAEQRKVAGLAGKVPTFLDLLAAAAGLGGAGHLAKSLAGISERVERTLAVELERFVPGRQFRSGEKRGCGVGKTKRGKGTKWMVVVDGRGVPLGDYLHSASPPEVRLARRGIELIAPHRSNRKKPTTQVGRALRRCRRRSIVERTNARLGNFRRLVVRYDRSLTIYCAFFHIACLMIVLQRVVQ